jgi:glycine oxidase
MSLTTDFVIVGGGVIGCAIASELSASGTRVILVERGDIASESSSAAAGLLVPLHAAHGSTPTLLLDFFLQSTAWFGLRPRSGDGAPVIGPIPGWKNVAVASGHFKMGITAAPLTTKVMRDYLVDGKWSPFLDAFNPSIFSNPAHA